MNEQKQQPSKQKDVYTTVTNHIIASLEKGVIPWRRPWKDNIIPQNLISGRAYKGINLWLLGMLGYEQNYFLTYRQVGELNATVKRGETGHAVIFWQVPESASEEMPDDEQVKQHAVLRYYTVYNIAQCENIPADKIPLGEPFEFEPLTECEAMLRDMPKPPTIQSKEHEAYYHPVKDIVNMPKQKSFESKELYYAVLLHELVHSTGHGSRLGREGVQEMTIFGSSLYSQEELIAEMGSCYLCAFAGIAPKPLENSVAYIKGWLEKLQNNKRILIFAAAKAQKAADYILGRVAETDAAYANTDETMVSA